MKRGAVVEKTLRPASVGAPPRAVRARLLRVAQAHPWVVGAVVLALYGIWIVYSLQAGQDPRDFIFIGSKFVLSSHASSIIQYDPSFRYNPTGGYDGQFCYFIALDPLHARYYMDVPVYRYTRILYPMLARVLALGKPSLIPYTLLLINWLAVACGTLVIGLWLRRSGITPWLALIYGLYSGLWIGLQRDLTEPLAYTLVALALYLFYAGGQRRLLWSAGVFALAALTRELTGIFAVVYGLALLAGPYRSGAWRERLCANWRRALVFLAVACLPVLLWRGFLMVWLGASGMHTSPALAAVPFAGLAAQWPWGMMQRLEVFTVAVPAMVCAGIGVWALRRGFWRAEVGALLANVLVCVVLLPPASWADIYASQRIATGVVVAALFCLPIADRLTRRNRTWLLTSGTCWLWAVPVWAGTSLIWLVIQPLRLRGGG